MGSCWVAFAYQWLAAVEILGVDVRVLGGLAAIASLCVAIGKFGGGLAKRLGRPRLHLVFDSDSEPVASTMY